MITCSTKRYRARHRKSGAQVDIGVLNRQPVDHEELSYWCGRATAVSCGISWRDGEAARLQRCTGMSHLTQSELVSRATITIAKLLQNFRRASRRRECLPTGAIGRASSLHYGDERSTPESPQRKSGG